MRSFFKNWPLREADAVPGTSATLIRRATFDPFGLPPSPYELEAFLADDSPDVWPRLIGRLLDSPHYGERWGVTGLIREATTLPTLLISVPEAFKYRNYVIDAFNNDKPYDQFVREQIAGGLLPASDEAAAVWNNKLPPATWPSRGALA